MKMKKLLLSLVVIILLVFAGCSSKDAKETEKEIETQTETETDTETETESESETETESETPEETEPETDAYTKEVSEVYQATLDKVDELNEGLSADEKPYETNRMYLNVYFYLCCLRDDLDKYRGQAAVIFGIDDLTDEEIEEKTNETLSYMVDQGGDYLSPLMKKLSTLESISGEFTSAEVTFTISDMKSTLDEISLSADSFGKILAMTNMYASEINFTDSGLEFHWKSYGTYEIDLENLSSDNSEEVGLAGLDNFIKALTNDVIKDKELTLSKAALGSDDPSVTGYTVSNSNGDHLYTLVFQTDEEFNQDVEAVAVMVGTATIDDSQSFLNDYITFISKVIQINDPSIDSFDAYTLAYGAAENSTVNGNYYYLDTENSMTFYIANNSN